MNTFALSSGAHIPVVGLGTWRMDDDEAERAIGLALEIGYRHIDTATMYGNEIGVGRAVRASGIPREDIFVTTKIRSIEFYDVEGALHKSLERLGLSYVDLYLIHAPIPDMPESIWKKMEKAYKDELTRSIGVSNYGIAEIDELLSYAEIAPMVDQIKCNPFDFNKPLFEYCSAKQIVFEAYTPLTRGDKLAHPSILALAAKHERTPAQILLRWNIEHWMVTIPKSADPERMRGNLAVFDFALDADDMRMLDALS